MALSDQYQPYLPEDGPMRYIRSGADHHLLKRLRRGDFVAEATLDLHGYTKQQAKNALIEGISLAHQQHMVCICVTHGHGHGILKSRCRTGWCSTRMWLRFMKRPST